MTFSRRLRDVTVLSGTGAAGKWCGKQNMGYRGYRLSDVRRRGSYCIYLPFYLGEFKGSHVKSEQIDLRHLIVF